MERHKLLVVSQKFQSFDADVIFKSSEGILFHIHRKNLEVCAEGFPPAEILTEGEVVELTETAATLDLLFQFMYPRRHPALDTTPFEILYPLAEAAEKYQVFPAMNICHIRLRDMVHEHPVELAVYAAKHDYPDLASEAAPMMISMDPVKVFEMLPPHLVAPWVNYVGVWTDVLQFVALTAPRGRNVTLHTNDRKCDGGEQWPVYALACTKRLGAGVHTLRALDAVFDVSQEQQSFRDLHRNNFHYDFAMRGCCTTDLAKWRKRIEDAILEIPKFSAFL